MNVLHFCSYYVSSRVFYELINSLSLHGKQFVYVPVRLKKQLNSERPANGEFYFVKSLNFFTRLFYIFKLFSVLYPALKKFLRNELVGVVHAHTLYSDGIPAYIFSKLANKKLIITLRNTDVNSGFRFYWHHKWLAKKALKYASYIVFVCPAHVVKFQRYFGSEFEEKIRVIPNGIDGFFLKNVKSKKVISRSGIIALHIASVNKNKNLKNTISAFFEATNQLSESEFRVAGGTYNEYVKAFGELPIEFKEKTVFLGKLDKNELLAEMDRATFFVMVSHYETFGLVYVEAISQCLPIVYTSGQGVDGYFNNGEFGFKADSKSRGSIAFAIKNTLEKFPEGLDFEGSNPALNFSWCELAKRYAEEIYV